MEEINQAILMGFILGGFLFGMSGFMIGDIFGPTPRDTTQETIDKIHQAEQDCLVKEYYYIDKQRDFCDMIGVKP